MGIFGGCFIFRFNTFGGRSAYLAYHVHKSGRKTLIIIVVNFRQLYVIQVQDNDVSMPLTNTLKQKELPVKVMCPVVEEEGSV